MSRHVYLHFIKYDFFQKCKQRDTVLLQYYDNLLSLLFYYKGGEENGSDGSLHLFYFLVSIGLMMRLLRR